MRHDALDCTLGCGGALYFTGTSTNSASCPSGKSGKEEVTAFLIPAPLKRLAESPIDPPICRTIGSLPSVPDFPRPSPPVCNYLRNDTESSTDISHSLWFLFSLSFPPLGSRNYLTAP